MERCTARLSEDEDGEDTTTSKANLEITKHSTNDYEKNRPSSVIAYSAPVSNSGGCPIRDRTLVAWIFTNASKVCNALRLVHPYPQNLNSLSDQGHPSNKSTSTSAVTSGRSTHPRVVHPTPPTRMAAPAAVPPISELRVQT